MALNPAQQAAVQALKTKLATASSGSIRQDVMEGIITDIRAQQEDQRTTEINQLIAAIKADPTWPDLVTILWAEIQLRI